MSGDGQGLIKRHPSLTRQQFNDYWLHTHAVVALYYALELGCSHYVQIHNPRLSDTAATAARAELRLEEWDGAAELRFAPRPGFVEPEKAQAFFRQVVVPDECRFLAGEARQHALFVGPGTVVGDRKVIIADGKVAVGEDGRPVVDVERAKRIWEEWDGEDAVAV